MARLIISDGSNAQTGAVYKVALNGIVFPIQRACVAQGGYVREYWPNAEPPVPPPDSRIAWTGIYESIYDQNTAPDDASAWLNFERATGLYRFNGQGSNVEFFLNPPLDGTPADDGKYLIFVHQVFGPALTGTLETWVDLNADFTVSLEQTGTGYLASRAEITIAADDGAGNPVAETEILKVVDFTANVQPAANKIAWTTIRRDLVDQKENEDALCSLVFNPTGVATGLADTSGAFNEDWHSDAPSAANPEDYVVGVSVISGTPPTGDALNTFLSLDQSRTWSLPATAGEDVSCELSVVVDDVVPAGNDITKVVTMHSIRGEPIPEPDWDTTAWSCTDLGYAQALSSPANVLLYFNPDGTAELEMLTTNLPRTTFETGTWFTGTPVLNDYEVMITGSTGTIVSGQIEGQWYRMDQVFELEYTTLPATRDWVFEALVRKVGGLPTAKTITVTVRAATGGVPD